MPGQTAACVELFSSRLVYRGRTPMSAYGEIPRLFFFLDRTYSYPTLSWARLHGREVNVAELFLNSGVSVSGKFILRVIASAMHGRVDLLRPSPNGETSWVMLTQDEAQLIILPLLAETEPRLEACRSSS